MLSVSANKESHALKTFSSVRQLDGSGVLHGGFSDTVLSAGCWSE